jgi:hypothetical protein
MTMRPQDVAIPSQAVKHVFNALCLFPSTSVRPDSHRLRPTSPQISRILRHSTAYVQQDAIVESTYFYFRPVRLSPLDFLPPPATESAPLLYHMTGEGSWYGKQAQLNFQPARKHVRSTYKVIDRLLASPTSAGGSLVRDFRVFLLGGSGISTMESTVVGQHRLPSSISSAL